MENKNMIGKFSWIELVTTDVPRSKDFYGEILGWSFWDNSSLYGNYNLALKDGKMICGIYKSSKLDGAKAHWNSYIFVEDIDYVVKQAVALGGTLERGPFEVMGMGRMASLRDPAGAWFSLWQELKQGKGLESDMSNEVGSFCWFELTTHDPKKVEKFYTQLFGWTTKFDVSMPNYTMFYKQEAMVAGMMQIPKEYTDATPEWFVYFSVDDCEKRTEQALKLNAKVMIGPRDIATVGRFSILTDPFGARCAFIKLLPQLHSTKLSELMTNSEIMGEDFRKNNFGQDVLKNKVHHQESKTENPKT